MLLGDQFPFSIKKKITGYQKTADLSIFHDHSPSTTKTMKSILKKYCIPTLLDTCLIRKEQRHELSYKATPGSTAQKCRDEKARWDTKSICPASQEEVASEEHSQGCP